MQNPAHCLRALPEAMPFALGLTGDAIERLTGTYARAR
jgi:hypothetical protein